MKKQIKKVFALIFLSIVMSAFSLDVPPLEKEFCHDTAGLLTSNQVEEIESFLKELNEKSKVQLALLTIPSLEDEVIEDYSIRVLKEWKLGDKQANSGALLLIAKNERKVRIDVGYGLEAVVTDAISSRIIRELMGPSFKKNDYFTGIRDGLKAISAYALQDETLIKEVEGKDKRKKDGNKTHKSPFTNILFFFGIALVISFLARKKVLPTNVSSKAGNVMGKISTGASALSSMAGISSLLNKDDSSDDGPLGGGGSFGGGGATGGW